MKSTLPQIYFTKLFSFLFFLTILFLCSCKKNELHKITFGVILKNYGQGELNYYIQPYKAIDAYSNSNGEGAISNKIKNWEYTHSELKKGDIVTFKINAQYSYYFRMYVIIDNDTMAVKEIKNSINLPYKYNLVEEKGNNDCTDINCITFPF